MDKFNPHSPDCKLSVTEKAQYKDSRQELIDTIERIGRYDIKQKLLDVYDQTHNDYDTEYK